MNKICSLCKNPNSLFNRSKKSKDGFASICKNCSNIRSSNWRKQNVEKWKIYNKTIKEQKREQNYRSKYGISIDVYESMLKSQNGACMICLKPEPKEKKLDVDHCHKTGKIRALLCSRCNKAIGLLEDNRYMALNVVYYLDKFNEEQLVSSSNTTFVEILNKDI